MKIFIDPGHGGNDPGAVGINGTYESNVVLGIALELGKILENIGFQDLIFYLDVQKKQGAKMVQKN